MSPSWSHFYSTEIIENNTKPIDSNSDSDSTHTNLSKMRSYLKRCESAISSISLSGKRPTQKMSNSARKKQSTSSWYIENIDEPGPSDCGNKNFNQLNCCENEMSTVQVTAPSMMLSLSQNQSHTTTIYVNDSTPKELDLGKPLSQSVSKTQNIMFMCNYVRSIVKFHSVAFIHQQLSSISTCIYSPKTGCPL